MDLRWALRAREDIIDIAEFYEPVAAGLADSLLDKIAEAPLILLDHPNLGTPAGRGRYRKWTVRGTPFVLIYRVRGSYIEIARVRHAASDWRPRS
ncbi:MAG: type II toxin-antitoxin system RelE/ParE family toxin [Alphaproteobacteria bacterium]|nr:type II toxin-antitoxin system RelE/ParE family toxin [Alphaproteobacteria bacterium]MBV9372997.1 type II toxin-antitoxin system RelE/ParE family toxin [Alphaproteobacteria bacterium]MBV9901364.1 type II toxin-antitoxin system RelE/ParE family toxin [Alphaproteobacteria bacterium]